MHRVYDSWRQVMVLFVILVLTGCDQPLVQNDLEALLARGELVMITRNNAACYYEGPRGPTGFEYELVRAFADHLGVDLRVKVIEEEADMIAALKAGEGDIIAAGFPFGSQSARLLALGPGYLEVEQQVVGRRGGPEIKRERDLEAYTLWMTGSSVRNEYLKHLRQSLPGLRWQILTAYSAEDLLQMVWNRTLQLTLVDSNIMAINHQYYPELTILLTLGAPRQLSWATDPRRHHLVRAMTDWFGRKTTRETIRGLVDHYFSHLEAFDYVDLARYRRRIKTVISRMRQNNSSLTGSWSPPNPTRNPTGIRLPRVTRASAAS